MTQSPLRYGYRMRGILLPGAVFLLLPACRPSFPAGDDPCRVQVHVDVLAVTDGDTVEVEYREGDQEGGTDDVRLIGIDTPEIDHDGDDHDCYALPAWQETIDLLEGQEAWLTFDQECTDEYGRVLAYVHRDEDGAFVNLHLVRQGFARACPFGVNDAFDDDFAEAEMEAQAEDLGRWPEPCNGGPECFQGGT